MIVDSIATSEQACAVVIDTCSNMSHCDGIVTVDFERCSASAFDLQRTSDGSRMSDSLFCCPPLLHSLFPRTTTSYSSSASRRHADDQGLEGVGSIANAVLLGLRDFILGEPVA